MWTKKWARLGVVAHLVVVVQLLTACIDDPFPSYTDEEYNLSLLITTRVGTSTVDDDEAGDDFETMIDIDNRDYRVYFFDSNSSDPSKGQLIYEMGEDILTGGNIYESTTITNDRQYLITAMADNALIMHAGDFKVVVLANWGSYPEVTTATTLADLLSDANALYTTELNDDTSYPLCNLPSHKLIPFYGIAECSNVSFSSATDLGTIYMLRAVAKVELILQTYETTSIDSAVFPAGYYNPKGYAAPLLYATKDYMSNGAYEWTSACSRPCTDGTTTNTLPATFCRVADTAEGYHRWVCYIPEHRNPGGLIPYKTDQLHHDIEPDPNYFTTDATINGSAIPIRRNYIYRFYITVEEGDMSATPKTWYALFVCEFNIT